MVDITKIEDGLNKLRGLDFEQAEREERTAGNTFPDVTFSKSFQARLAAAAIGVTVHDINELPLREFNRATQAVFNFLFGSSVEETQSTSSEA